MSARERLAAVSIDLDEIPCYHRVHGLPPPDGRAARAVYDRALERHLALLESLDVPATFFVVGADLADDENVRRLRVAHEAGHEVANHTLAHRYDLVRRSRDEIRREVEGGIEAIERALDERPEGFRAPGYNVSEDVFGALAEAGVRYDSSLLGSAPYLAARAGILLVMRVLGRRSESIVGDPRAVLAPAEPYRVGRPHWRRGDGILELPIGVVPGLGVPFIGTTLVLAGATGAGLLARAMSVRRFVHLELHGIDLCDAGRDGLAELRRHQPDLRRSLEAKEAALRAALDVLRERGYRFVRLRDLVA